MHQSWALKKEEAEEKDCSVLLAEKYRRPVQFSVNRTTGGLIKDQWRSETLSNCLDQSPWLNKGSLKKRKSWVVLSMIQLIGPLAQGWIESLDIWHRQWLRLSFSSYENNVQSKANNGNFFPLVFNPSFQVKGQTEYSFFLSKIHFN